MATCGVCHKPQRPSRPHGYTAHWAFFDSLDYQECPDCGQMLEVDNHQGVRIAYESSPVTLYAADGLQHVHTPERCRRNQARREAKR
jgi:hypothetical protein